MAARPKVTGVPLHSLSLPYMQRGPRKKRAPVEHNTTIPSVSSAPPPSLALHQDTESVVSLDSVPPSPYSEVGPEFGFGPSRTSSQKDGGAYSKSRRARLVDFFLDERICLAMPDRDVLLCDLCSSP